MAGLQGSVERFYLSPIFDRGIRTKRDDTLSLEIGKMLDKSKLLQY